MQNHHIPSELCHTIDVFPQTEPPQINGVWVCVCIDLIQYVASGSCFHLFDVIVVYGSLIDKGCRSSLNKEVRALRQQILVMSQD